MVDHLDAAGFTAFEGVEDWRVVWGGGWACTHFRTASFAAGAALVRAIDECAAELQHWPDVDLRPDGVTIRLFTTLPGGLTMADVELARSISLVARAHGLTADPTVVQHVQVAIDALDIPSIRPFWCAVLGYEGYYDSDVFDPLRRGPSFWFQQMDGPRPHRNRFHIDVYVPRDQADVRLAAAIAAGGRVVSDAHAPGWWTLADAEGNVVDLAVWG